MRRVVFAVMLLASAGCSTGPASGASYPAPNRTVLFADEIDKSGGLGRNAYDLLAQLRPEFLRSRGATTLQKNSAPSTATVYLDGVKYGDLQSLKLISAEHITIIRYLNGSEATTRYGTDHVGGAILITTK
jgi:hypothetical protein